MGPKHVPQTPTRSETKAESTHAVAKTLIDKETAARVAKTKRLRAARLEREAFEPKAEAPAKKGKVSQMKRTKP